MYFLFTFESSYEKNIVGNEKNIEHVKIFRQVCWVAPVWQCGRADQSTANSANSNCQRGDHSVDESNDDRVSVFKLTKMISIHIWVRFPRTGKMLVLCPFFNFFLKLYCD